MFDKLISKINYVCLWVVSIGLSKDLPLISQLRDTVQSLQVGLRQQDVGEQRVENRFGTEWVFIYNVPIQPVRKGWQMMTFTPKQMPGFPSRPEKKKIHDI